MPEILGKILKKAREAKQLSIEEVSDRTRIPKKIISAIEEDRLNEISSVFYARGFVRSYAKFLGCEDEKAVKDYLAGSEKKKEEPRLALDNESVPGDWFIKYKKTIAIVLLAVFSVWVFGLGIVQLRKFTRNISAKYRNYAAKKKEIKKEAEPKTLPEKEIKEAKPQPAAASEDKRIQAVELEITAQANTWIQIESDNLLLFKGIFKKGSKDTWRAKKEIKLEIGNAGEVTLKFNGKDLGCPGKKGEKKTVVVTKDGVKL